MNVLHVGLLGEDGRVGGHFTRVLSGRLVVRLSQRDLMFVRTLPLQLKFQAILISQMVGGFVSRSKVGVEGEGVEIQTARTFVCESDNYDQV